MIKRTCDNCRALDGGNSKFCAFHYKIVLNGKRIMGVFVPSWKPLEECEKPITIKKYMLLRKQKLG